MASKRAIGIVFAVLNSAGKPQPSAWKEMGLPGIIDTWAMLLDDVPDNALIAAAKIYARDGGKFWPSLGELTALIPPAGGHAMGPAAAWARLLDGIRWHGRDKPPGLPPEGMPLPPGVAAFGITRAIPSVCWRLADRDDENDAAMLSMQAAGGWQHLCDADAREIGYAQRTFDRCFRETMTESAKARRWLQVGGPSPDARQLVDTKATEAPLDITAAIEAEKRRREGR